MWETSSVSLQYLYLQNTQKRKSQQALCFTAQNESVHKVVQNMCSTRGMKMGKGKCDIMFILFATFESWAQLFLSFIITVVVKSKLSTLPVPELTIGHDLLPVHSNFCLTDCILVLCCNFTLLLQSSVEVFTPKLYFFLNNQPDALIIQIYSVIRLYMFRASSLPIIRSFLLYIRHW